MQAQANQIMHAPTALSRRGLLGFAAAGAAALTLGARTARAADSGATAPVEALGRALVQVMRAGSATPFAQRFAMIAPAVDRAFDLNTILRVSVGPRWDSLAPAEQAQLEQVFRNYTIASYVANFNHYEGQSVQVSASGRNGPGGEQIIDSQVGDAKLSYVMRPTAAGWRAVDVLADGSISRVAVQRSDFRSLINTGGGPALVASLQRKVSDLSGGSLA